MVLFWRRIFPISVCFCLLQSKEGCCFKERHKYRQAFSKTILCYGPSGVDMAPRDVAVIEPDVCMTWRVHLSWCWAMVAVLVGMFTANLSKGSLGLFFQCPGQGFRMVISWFRSCLTQILALRC